MGETEKEKVSQAPARGAAPRRGAGAPTKPGAEGLPPPCAGKVQQQALEGKSPTWVTALTDFQGLDAAPGGSLMLRLHCQHDTRDLVQSVGGWCARSSIPSGPGTFWDRRPQPSMPGMSPPCSVHPGGCLEEVSSGELQKVAAGGVEGTLKAGPLVYRVAGVRGLRAG